MDSYHTARLQSSPSRPSITSHALPSVLAQSNWSHPHLRKAPRCAMPAVKQELLPTVPAVVLKQRFSIAGPHQKKGPLVIEPAPIDIDGVRFMRLQMNDPWMCLFLSESCCGAPCCGAPLASASWQSLKAVIKRENQHAAAAPNLLDVKLQRPAKRPRQEVPILTVQVPQSPSAVETQPMRVRNMFVPCLYVEATEETFRWLFTWFDAEAQESKQKQEVARQAQATVEEPGTAPANAGLARVPKQEKDDFEALDAGYFDSRSPRKSLKA